MQREGERDRKKSCNRKKEELRKKNGTRDVDNKQTDNRDNTFLQILRFGGDADNKKRKREGRN